MSLVFSIYYTEEEKAILDTICQVNGITVSAIEQLIEEEADFHGMGRRRGLFPAIRRIVERATEERLNSNVPIES